MQLSPASHEVATCIGAFFWGGAGPTHRVLTRVFKQTGYDWAGPHSSFGDGPNKEDRVIEAVLAAEEHPARAHDLVNRLLAELRADGCFSPDDQASPEFEEARQNRVRRLREALARLGWDLSADGELHRGTDLRVQAAAGRPAIEEQLARLRRTNDDPALLVGTAKEMLESTAKYVLEQFGTSYTEGMDFGTLWYLARDRLGIHPKQVDASAVGGEQLRKILQSMWTISEQVNEIRSKEGTGHGRTLPSGMSDDVALLIVREACSVAEFTLKTLDRQFNPTTNTPNGAKSR